MNIFWNQYKAYIITLSIAVFGVALVWFGMIPMQKRIKDQMNRSQEVMTDQEIHDELVASLSDVLDQKDVVEAKENQLQVVINRSDIVDLVKDIEALAKETNNTIAIDAKDQLAAASANKLKKSTTTDEKAAEKTIIDTLPSEHSIGIAIKLTGSYSDIVAFIQKLESMPYETDIVAFSLAVYQPSTSSNQPRTNIFASSLASPETQPGDAAPTIQPGSDLPLEAILDTVVYVNED
ncbi:MAG: hypothetical protein PHT88_04050 [Candidatus Moranbacteria bacterium]|nr:hypothetical protein [Candidatus Moranbacteria bacterium]